MYAVVEISGRQYRVSPGDEILVEKLEKAKGDSFDVPVLLISDESGVRVGSPHVEGAKVSAQVLGESKGEKLTIFQLLTPRSATALRRVTARHTRV